MHTLSAHTRRRQMRTFLYTVCWCKKKVGHYSCSISSSHSKDSCLMTGGGGRREGISCGGSKKQGRLRRIAARVTKTNQRPCFVASEPRGHETRANTSRHPTFLTEPWLKQFPAPGNMKRLLLAQEDKFSSTLQLWKRHGHRTRGYLTSSGLHTDIFCIVICLFFALSLKMKSVGIQTCLINMYTSVSHKIVHNNKSGSKHTHQEA